MRVVVTGGAGYVGSVCTAVLIEKGYEVTIIDDLSVGNRYALHPDASFVEGDVRDVAHDVLANGEYDGVFHFAAKSLVGESVEVPADYWQNNVVTTLALLDAMRANSVGNLVFSSSAATYGEPATVPITEDFPTAPTNPYGATKLTMDHVIASYCKAYGIGATSLRYFNVAGAYGHVGENRKVETHIIPIILEVAMGYRDKIVMYGDDWPTPDGTPIRDYIHIKDLADAHVLAFESNESGVHRIYNLGSGEGYSVKQIVEMCRKVTGRDIPAAVGPRRAGDPAILVASSERIKEDLGWEAPNTELRTIISDAWSFTQQLGDKAWAAQR